MTDVARLCDRLARAPELFLSKLEGRPTDPVALEAVVADLARERFDRWLTPEELGRFRPPRSNPGRRRALGIALVTAWLLHDESFRGVPADRAVGLLDGGVAPLADLYLARVFVEEAERREELVRLTLHHLGLLPSGESAAEAEDRLAVLDSVRRQALLRDAEARERERAARRAEVEGLAREEEEARRQAARTTFED